MREKDRSFTLQNNQTVVFIGDSITDCGRREGPDQFGDGYVKFAIDLIMARYPHRPIRFINRGVGGDVSVELQVRWKEDVLAHRPDWVSVLIGINDLHRRFRTPVEMDVPPDLYRSAYLDCLTRTAQETQARLVLMDPFYICQDPEPGSIDALVLAELPRYIAVVREMADKFHALYVPLQEIFSRQLEYRPASTFCPEPIHPNRAGHMVIALAWLTALGW